jgi:sugar-specific transcriptional regulator TrmB
MKKICIHQRIIQAMGLSSDELKVFDVLLSQQMAREGIRIARMAGVPRRTTARILRDFEKRGLVVKRVNFKETKVAWMYKKGLDRLRLPKIFGH